MCMVCEWEEIAGLCGEMLEDPAALSQTQYAAVHDVERWVSENEHVTEKQAEMIKNIYYQWERNR